jgi:hypothetical protein
VNNVEATCQRQTILSSASKVKGHSLLFSEYHTVEAESQECDLFFYSKASSRKQNLLKVYGMMQVYMVKFRTQPSVLKSIE